MAPEGGGPRALQEISEVTEKTQNLLLQVDLKQIRQSNPMNCGLESIDSATRNP